MSVRKINNLKELPNPNDLVRSCKSIELRVKSGREDTQMGGAESQ